MSSLPPPYQRLQIDQLSDYTRERLRNIAQVAALGPIAGRDNIGGELGWVLLGLAIIGINVFLAIGHPSGEWERFTLQSLIGVPFVVWGGNKLLRRYRAGIPTFLHALPAYFIGVDGNHVVFWSWASASAITLTDRYLNGVFLGTNVSIEFGDRSLTVSAANHESAQRLAAQYGRLRDQARAQADQGSWHALEGADLLPSGAAV